MTSVEHAKPPAPRSPLLERAISQSPVIALADVVAATAHAAIGQRRADRVTPYIDHPRRTAALILEWSESGVLNLDGEVLERCVAAALLHDVLEDTKLPRSELRSHFPDRPKLLALVDRMTEPPGDPNAPEYYRSIAEDPEAVIVKCADRCANLEDVLRDVRRRHAVERWERYLGKTERLVLPILRDEALERELQSRMDGIRSVIERG